MPHDRIERRSLALHKAIAAKLRGQPDLLATAQDNIERWSRQRNNSQPYLDEWREILRGPLSEILELIEQDTPRMGELRQSTPFAGVLDPRERWHIYDTFESGAHHPCGGSRR